MQSYLKFIFPAKITIERKEESDSVVPKFFTFMSTDCDGHNAYFHCLVFFEYFTNEDIKNDFDNVLLESRRKSVHRKHEDHRNNLNFHLKQAKIRNNYHIPVYTAKGITNTSSDEN